MNRTTTEGDTMNTLQFAVDAERDAYVVDRVRTDLLSGRSFTLAAEGVESIIGYQPPLGYRRQRNAIRLIAEGMTDDRQTELLAPALRCFDAGLTPPQAVGKAYRFVAASLDQGFEDVVRKASPEPGRKCDWHHDYTLADVLRASQTLRKAYDACIPGEGGTGWCEAILCEIEGIR